MSDNFQLVGANNSVMFSSMQSLATLANKTLKETVNKTNNNYLTNIYDLNGFIQLTSMDSKQILQKMIIKTNNSKVANMKKNSISDSSTADSDSGYIDDQESDNELFTEHLAKSPAKKRIISGFAGRAKNDSEPVITKQLEKRFITLNYGDDVGFISSKNLNNTKFITHEIAQSSDDPSRLINKYYFGLADGVSANRARGYDAKLFPNALVNECVDICDQSDEYYLNYAINSRSSKMIEAIKNKETNVDQLANVLKDYKINRYSEHEDDYEEYDDDIDEDEEEENNDDCEDYEYSSYSELEIEENDCDKLKVILSNAHDNVQEKKVYGSSTACILSLEFYETSEFSLLSSCNVGDSGYMIIRDKNVLFKSQSQSHRYNAPFQLGCTPPELVDHNFYRDKAEDSICHSHLVKSGDFLIISSDGMFDNLYEDEIALIIDQNINSSCSVDSPLKITSEQLSSICNVIVQRASRAGIKQDDMLVLLIYID